MASNNNLHPSPSSSPSSHGRPKKLRVAKTTKPVGPTPIDLPQSDGRTEREAIAYAVLKPSLRHGNLVGELANILLSKVPDEDRPGIAEYRKELAKQVAEAEGGDLTIATQLLAAQALSLDAIFSELSRRSAINLNGHLDAAERYMRLALKAQSGCRTTLQALADLHRPREQTVRHVHVSDGGQAVVADQFHHHPPPERKHEAIEQPHAPDMAAGSGAALPGPNEEGNAVPGTSRKRKAKVPHARRD